MADRDRYNRVNIHHHLREDVVVLLPHVAYRNGTIGFGNGTIVPRHDSTSIGDAILHMLDHCATADTGPLEEKRDAAMHRLRQGFALSFDEQFPSFDIPDNWGRIYERYPAILCNPWVSTRYFTTADIDDHDGSDSLTLRQLQLKRKDRGIYTTGDLITINRIDGPAVIGGHVSERLNCWRPKSGFLARLIA